jgi:hypothetical protein
MVEAKAGHPEGVILFPLGEHLLKVTRPAIISAQTSGLLGVEKSKFDTEE